jgi:hypothetical protein
MTAAIPPGTGLVAYDEVEAQAINNLSSLTGGTFVKGIGQTPAEILEAEIIYEIHNAIESHPRSLQRAIGPSQLGTTCTKHLLHMLNHDPEPIRGAIPWLPTIGTAVHSLLRDVFDGCTDQQLNPPRYLVEHRVEVGNVAGVPITGSSDLFDTHSGTVVDWKIIGKTVMQDYRRKGPRPSYRAQAHLYGRGFALQGYQVNTVMLAFLPRNELSLNARYFWSEPYDERVALAALDRATALTNLIKAVGIDAALAMYPNCDDTRLCPYCFAPATPRLPATTTRELFSGSLKGISA